MIQIVLALWVFFAVAAPVFAGVNQGAAWVLEQAKLSQERPVRGNERFTASSADMFAHDCVFAASAYSFSRNETLGMVAKQRLLTAARNWNKSDAFVVSNDSLDFSIAMVSLAYAYGLIQSNLSKQESTLIRERFFMPAAEAIRKNMYGKDDRQRRSNHRSWQNAAVGALGRIVGRQDLVDWAVRDPQGGFQWQIQNAFGSDGLQWEGSPRYQLYAMAAMANLAEAVEDPSEPSLWNYTAPNGNQLADLFRGLLEIAESNGRLPNVNARQQENLENFACLYALAFRRTHRQELGWVSRQTPLSVPDRPWTYPIDAAMSANPVSASETSGTPPLVGSDVEEDMGWATLRTGSGTVMGVPEPLYALFKYSRFKGLGQGQGSAHEHADKGLLEIRANGIQWAAARSRQNTSDALYAGFDRQTVAKNTVVVDQTSQPGARNAFDSEGASGGVFFSALRPRIKIVQAHNDAAYDLSYARTVAVIGDPGSDGLPAYVIDLFDLHDRRPRLWDYVMRGGEEDQIFLDSGLPALKPAAFDAALPGYGFLRDTQSANVKTPFMVSWGSGSQGLALHVLAPQGAVRVFRSLAPGVGGGRSFPHVILRREKSPAAGFRVVHEPFTYSPVLKPQLVVDQPDFVAILVEGPHQRDWFLFRPLEAGKSEAEFGGEVISINGRYGLVRVRDGAVDLDGDITNARVKTFGEKRVAEPLLNGKPIKATPNGSFLQMIR
jgi:hypothetical protein